MAANLKALYPERGPRPGFSSPEVGADDYAAYMQLRQKLRQPPQGVTLAMLLEDLETIMEEIKGLFPANCRFTNARLDVQMVSQDTGLIRVAPIPVCIIQKNWREF